MEQRRAVRLRRAAVPIRKLRTGPRLVLNRLNQPTSQDRSFFHKSLSAPAPHLSPAPQETTESFRSQQGRTRPTMNSTISESIFFKPRTPIHVSNSYAAMILLSLR